MRNEPDEGMALSQQSQARADGDFVAIASVVPKALEALEATLARQNVGYFVLSAENAPGLEIAYRSKATLGADRIANALWLSARPHLPAIAVDFGTATKIDVVDAKGRFLGGAILPSAKMMVDSLSGGTAQLREVPLEPPPQSIGRNTTESLQSGTVLALAHAIEGLLEAAQVELGDQAAIYGTGGLCAQFAPLCPSIGELEPLLTLKGLLIAARRWSPGS